MPSGLHWLQDEEQSAAVSQGRLQFWDVVMVRKVERRRIRIWKFIMFFCCRSL